MTTPADLQHALEAALADEQAGHVFDLAAHLFAPDLADPPSPLRTVAEVAADLWNRPTCGRSEPGTPNDSNTPPTSPPTPGTQPGTQAQK